MLVAALAVGAAGTAASIALAVIPWSAPVLPLPPWVLPMIAIAGSSILVIATVAPRGAVRNGVVVLGGSVLLYPTLLGAACATVAGTSGAASDLVEGLAFTGHVIPLVMLQLLPVLAMRAAAGRPAGWVPWLIVIANTVDVVLLVLANTVPVLGTMLGPLSSLLWLGMGAAAPVITWSVVTRTTGRTRRRAVLIAISSVISVLILAFCFVLGLSEQIQQIGMAASVVLLMAGFSIATVSAASLVVLSLGSASGWWLRTHVLSRLLAGVLFSATVLGAAIVALLGAGAGLGAWEAAILAGALGLAAGIAAARLHGWTTRIVDPVAELRAELSTMGTLTDGTLQARVERAMQRAVNDPGLRLTIGSLDADVAVPGHSPEGVALTSQHDPGAPQVYAQPTTAASARRVRRLADVSSLMWAVVLEAEVERERARADGAATAERDRLRRNLHDGLQSRLLGIALRLQLEGAQHPDPTTRGIVDETVAALRSAADEARVLADGRVPDALQQGGLRDAVTEFVGGLGSFVLVDIPALRFPAPTEETGYFVVGEAVGNAIKHGAAQSIGVQVRGDERVLTITVSDDGIGGADPRAGSGLRRLSERVSASGGILTVRDAQPHGTVVEVSLPCAS